MKIAVVAHLKYAIAQPFAGGLEMHTHVLADSLIRRGHDVTLFAATGSTPRLGLSAVCQPTGEGQDDPVAQRGVDDAEAAAYRIIMDNVANGDFDIVHNNSLHPYPISAAARLDVPIVTALHTPPFEPLADAVCSAGPNVAFVAVSADLASHWEAQAGPINVIPNGIDLGMFRPGKRRDRPRHAFWSGRIVPEKGFHLAIDAVRLAGLPLIFAGPRPDEDYWTREIAPRLGDDLVDLGHLSHATLAPRLGDASVAIVSPCWDEPFGLVVAEALACGTPVAAFARGAIPSLLDTRCGVLARPGDTRDLARAIGEALLCSRDACRHHAEQRFDSERMVTGYETLYGRLTSCVSAPEDTQPAATPRGDVNEVMA